MTNRYTANRTRSGFHDVRTALQSRRSHGLPLAAVDAIRGLFMAVDVATVQVVRQGSIVVSWRPRRGEPGIWDLEIEEGR